MRPFLLIICFSICSMLASAGEKNIKWPGIRIFLSEQQLNSSLKVALSDNDTLKLHANLFPESDEIEICGNLKINFSRFSDITDDSPYSGEELFPDGIPFCGRFIFRIMSKGSLSLTMSRLALFDKKEELIINDFSFFTSLLGVLLVETELCDIIEDQIKKIDPIRVGEEAKQIVLDLASFGIKKNIRFEGSSILIKLIPSEIVKGTYFSISEMKDPRLWYAGVFFDLQKEEKTFFIAIGDGEPDARYRDFMRKQRESVAAYFKKER